MCIEWFEHILRQQAVVDTRVLVLFELGQFILPDVNHDCRLCKLRGVVLRAVIVGFVVCWEEKHEVEDREAGL